MGHAPPSQMLDLAPTTGYTWRTRGRQSSCRWVFLRIGSCTRYCGSHEHRVVTALPALEDTKGCQKKDQAGREDGKQGGGGTARGGGSPYSSVCCVYGHTLVTLRHTQWLPKKKGNKDVGGAFDGFVRMWNSGEGAMAVAGIGWKYRGPRQEQTC
jgi:hypothetical protein